MIKDVVITLVFSIVLLLIMLYPAIKIVGYIESKRELSQKVYTILTLTITVILSVIAGAFLYYF